MATTTYTTNNLKPKFSIADKPSTAVVNTTQTQKGSTIITAISDGQVLSSATFPLPEGLDVGGAYSWSGVDEGMLGKTLENFIEPGMENYNDNNFNSLGSGMSAAWDTLKKGLGNSVDDLGYAGATWIKNVLGAEKMNIAGRQFGLTYNPNKALHFEGIDFKEYDLKFNFVPSSPDEANQYISAINQLKALSAPSYAGNGAFFKYPPFFKVRVIVNRSKVIIARPPSAITRWSISLPQHITWHTDGLPAEWSLTIGFKEAVLPIDSVESKYTLFNVDMESIQ